MAMTEFEGLIDAHYAGLYRFALALAKNRDIAADLVQQTFCIWARKGHQLRDRSKAKTWLYTTLHREFLAHARRSRKYSDEEVTEDLVGEAGAPEDRADRRMDARRALELLGGLDEVFRAPITLFYLRQHSYKEIAATLDIPMGTVMSRISRAKAILKRRMDQAPATAPKNILHMNPKTLSQTREPKHG
jgi:RNA polymerase sigma-70 factor (ECF subfamily)